MCWLLIMISRTCVREAAAGARGGVATINRAPASAHEMKRVFNKVILRSQAGTHNVTNVLSGLRLGPVQELAERGTAMAILRLFLGAQFCECLLNLREKEQRIIAKPI